MKKLDTYEKESQTKYLYLIMIAMIITFLTSNILSYKFVEIAGIKFGAAAALFPFSLIVGDILSEVYGFKKTRLAIFISVICYMFFTLMAQFTVWLPPAPEWNMQEEYQKFFSTSWRVLIATSLAFIVSQIVNSYVLVWLKQRFHGKQFSFRAIVSTIFGEFSHTLVVAPILFGHILTFDKLIGLIFTATCIKVAVEIIVLPVTVVFINKLKRLEIDGSI